MIKDMISVIIPCYNVEKFLDDCFESLEKQTYQNFEAIFINDGSKDNTLAKIKEFCKNKEKYKYIDQTNKGVSAARNAGIKQAEGEFLFFFDSDDLLSPDIFEILHNNMVNNDCDYSVCAYKTTKEDFKYKDIKPTKKKSKEILFTDVEEMIMQLYSTTLFTNSSSNKLYKHFIFQKMKNYPNVYNSLVIYGEDLDLNFNYLCLVEKNGIFTNQKLYYYRSRKGSLVHSKFNKKHLSIFISHDKNIQICSDKFEKAKIYIEASKCISCVEMIGRIYSSDFNDRATLLYLKDNLVRNIKSLKKAKKFQFYKRFFIPMAVPIFKFMANSKLKTTGGGDDQQ